MEGTPFLPLPEGMLIDQVQMTENGLCVAVIATHPTSRCPLCSECSSSIHSTYRRCVRDVSWPIRPAEEIYNVCILNVSREIPL